MKPKTAEGIAKELAEAIKIGSALCVVCGAKHELILGVPESYEYCRKCAREQREANLEDSAK